MRGRTDVPCLLDLNNNFIVGGNGGFLGGCEPRIFNAIEEEGFVGGHDGGE